MLSRLHVNAVRYAKRRGVKALRKAKELKLGIGSKGAKVDKTVKPSAFLSGKQNLSIALQHPARRESDSDLLEHPVDSVWYTPSYAPALHPFAKALALHRQLQHETMLNNAQAPVRVRFDLNMALQGKKKYVEEQSGLVAMPCPFAHGQKRTIMAFARDPAVQVLASEAGAEITGGSELVKKILKGSVRIDDVNYAVCHVDIASELNPLRGLMKRKFPSRKFGAVGGDLPSLVRHFINGIAYAVQQDAFNPNWGVCQALVGHLNMANEDLEANFKTLLATVYAVRDPPKRDFIHRTVVMVMPGEEYFHVDIEPYLPETKVEPEDEEDEATG